MDIEIIKNSIEENLKILNSFPQNFTNSLNLSENLNQTENQISQFKLKVEIAEILNSIRTILKVSNELEILKLVHQPINDQ